jgi:RHS repeat-associated protein
MQGRNYTADNYRFGYQGSEKETGVSGMYTTDYRALDTRLGKWFSPDAINQPWQSPYCSMDNNPIALTDVLGLSTGDAVGGAPGANASDLECGSDCGASVEQSQMKTDVAVNSVGFSFDWTQSANIAALTSYTVTPPNGSQTKGSSGGNPTKSYIGADNKTISLPENAKVILHTMDEAAGDVAIKGGTVSSFTVDGITYRESWGKVAGKEGYHFFGYLNDKGDTYQGQNNIGEDIGAGTKKWITEDEDANTNSIQEFWKGWLTFYSYSQWLRGPGFEVDQIVSTLLTRKSVADKLLRYLLNPAHAKGGPKAKWFEEALGFTAKNYKDLAKQIVWDATKAIKQKVIKEGTLYEQTISIVGANGRTIDVKFIWIKTNEGIIKLVTALPTKK